jgi:hypothetical protein
VEEEEEGGRGSRRRKEEEEEEENGREGRVNYVPFTYRNEELQTKYCISHTISAFSISLSFHWFQCKIITFALRVQFVLNFDIPNLILSMANDHCYAHVLCTDFSMNKLAILM